MTSAPDIRRLALPALTLSALALAGCTHDGVGSTLSLEDTVQPRARAEVMALAPRRERAVVPRPAMVSLPGDAGGSGVVRTRDYADGLRQDIALDGTKVPLVRNGITLLARTAGPGDGSLERVPLVAPGEAMIRSEIGAALPHVTMQVIEQERSNDYGPYGLALGRVGTDDRCLYMWQWIDADRLPRDSGLAGPASLRMRLCRAGVTFDEMAGWADHLRIEPVAAVAAGDGRVLPPDALPTALPAPVARSGRLPAHRDRHGEQHLGRRRLGERQVDWRPRRPPLAGSRGAEPAEAPLAASATSPTSSAPRYLTPDTAAPAAMRAQPAATAAAASVSPKFGGDLPPEAFAGPRIIPLTSPRS